MIGVSRLHAFLQWNVLVYHLLLQILALVNNYFVLLSFMRFLKFILKVNTLLLLSILVAAAVFVYQMKKILYKQTQASIPSLSVADNLIAHYINLIVAFPSSYWTEKNYEQFYELYPFSYFLFPSVSFILLISMIIRNILLLKQLNQMLLGQFSLQSKLVIMLLLVLISS